MFPKWEGYDISYRYYGDRVRKMPFVSRLRDIVCIVQYIYIGDDGHKWDYKDIQQMREKWKDEVAGGGDYPVLSYIPVKAYADRDVVERIMNRLYSPEYRQNHNDVETYEEYLLLIEIDRKLNSQTIIRVPYKLTEDGHAITPRGKDKELYEILNSGLKEWEGQKKAEKDRDDAIHRLLRQGIDSPHADYNALFLELKKLDALFGAKDPNDLKLIMQKQKEGLRQMGLFEEPNQSNYTVQPGGF